MAVPAMVASSRDDRAACARDRGPPNLARRLLSSFCGVREDARTRREITVKTGATEFATDPVGRAPAGFAKEREPMTMKALVYHGPGRRSWEENITLTTRLVDTVTTPMLLKVVQSGKVQPAKLVTHRFKLADVMKAYDVFGNAAKERALKVVLEGS
jgi:Zn-dependent alcohol dehydrogenase